MDFQRLFLFLIFSFSALLLWDNWQRAQHPTVPAATNTAAVTPASAPAETDSVSKPKPSAEAQLAGVQTAVKAGKLLHVKTDVLSLTISTVGGDIRHLDFLKQRASKDDSKPFVLMKKTRDRTYITESGLLDNNLPNHNAEYTSPETDYQLAEGKDELQVKLLTTTADGVKVTKIYTFHRGSYLVDVTYAIDNNSKSEIKASSAYFQFVRDKEKPEGSTKFVPTYFGPAVYTDKSKFEKIKFSDIEKDKTDYPESATDGWMAMLQHYFTAVWIPKEGTKREYYTKHLDNDLYSAGVILSVPNIEPGKTGQVGLSLYAGPATSSLDKIAPGLDLTVDYGWAWVTILAKPLFWMLSLFHGWVHNWGLAIILLTVLIKLFFFPLSAASYRSMAKMRVVAPKLEKIKKQYGDDRERLHKAMMELYKTEKINPLGGCLPIMVQIPVFISLYWTILASVELRHAPFFGWITDLSAADPYYVLPLIMGASMYVQTKLNPTPPDPIQAKVMQIMPLMFSVMFFFFPAGLVIYSVVNNVLSIAQQWVITRGTTKDKEKGAANT